jgi:hypothetical protein
MNKFIPVTLVQNQTLDSNGEIIFMLLCDNHYNHNGRYVLSSDTCDFMDTVDNGDYTKSCKYYSTLGCGCYGLRSYFCRSVANSLKNELEFAETKHEI